MGRPHFQVIFSSFGMPEIDFGTKSEEPEHLSFFRSSGVRYKFNYLDLLTNHRTTNQLECDVIGRKNCRWLKFRRSGVRSCVEES